MAGQRRYPRVPLEQPGEMEVRLRRDAAAGPRSLRVPVVIRTVSCEGMGVVLRSDDVKGVGVGAPVTMRLSAGATSLEIPGRIAWFDRRQPRGRFDLGVHLQLEIARAAMRQQWAEWVVELIRSRASAAEL